MADKIFVCKKDECKVGFEKYAYLKSHYMGKHPSEAAPPEEDCGVDSLPEGYSMRVTKASKKTPAATNTVTPPVQEATARANTPPASESTNDSVYKKESDSTSILHKIMSGFPGLKPEVVKEVLSYAEFHGTLHPSDVRYYLSMMEGVSKNTTELVVHKYGLALQKAAIEGNNAIRTTVANWQFGPQTPSEMPVPMIPGQTGHQQPFNQTGMPPLQYGVPYPPPAYPNYPGYPYYAPYTPNAPQQPPPQEGVQSGSEIDARFSQMKEEMNEVVASLSNAVQALSNQIIQTEEQKKEEALNARLEKLESLIIQVANAPKTDENANAAAEAIKEVQLQISAMREEANANKISALEEKIGSLTDALAQNKDNEITNLRAQLEEIKRIASEKTVTGRSEYDTIFELANKALEKIGEAGKDVRAVVMRQATEQLYDPLRSNAADRALKGEQIAAVVENEANLQEKEKRFLITQ